MLKPLITAVFLAFAVLSFGFAEIKANNFPVYTDASKLSKKLTMLDQMFKQTKNFDQQSTIMALMMDVNDPDKNDVFMDMVLHDLKGGSLCNKVSGETFSDVRIQACSNVSLSGEPKYVDGFWNILMLDNTLDVRLFAAKGLGKIQTPESVNRLVSLLNYKYNYTPFKPENKIMDREDRIAEEMVHALGDIGSPKCLPILLQIVNMQNHRKQTVDTAWEAIEKLKIEGYGYKYFIVSLKDTMKDKTEQVSYEQKDQVDKTVQILIKFIKDNFEKYGYTQDDIETAKGTLKEKK